MCYFDLSCNNREKGRGVDLILLLLAHLQVSQQAFGEEAEVLQSGVYLQQNTARYSKQKTAPQ